MTPTAALYNSDNYLVLDFETEVNDGAYGSAIDPRNSLQLACYRYRGVTYSHWGSEFQQGKLLEAIADADYVVGHNLKYEYGWLRRAGCDLSRVMGFDTKLAEYVLLGNLAAGDPDTGVRRVGTSLDECCIRRGFAPKDPIVDLWMKHGIKVSQMPRRWVEDRCRLDVESTERLFLDQRARLLRTGRIGVLFTRSIFTPCLASIEAEGMHLESERVSRVHAEYSSRLVELEKEFGEVTGNINWRSPRQVADYLYDNLGFPEPKGRNGEPKRTATGHRLANKRVIEGLRPSTDDQRRFIELRKDIGKVGSALSKSLNYFKDACDNRKGTFLAEFNQAVTATHRLSCSGIRTDAGTVQFQNLPRAFKPLFCARKAGWLIGEADGSQLEFRVAAFLGNDKQAKADINDPEWDAHLVTAAEMVGRPYEELRLAYKSGDKAVATLRQQAKAETFKPLYGGSKGTKAQERWYEGFKRRYPDLARVQKDWVHEVLATKRLITPWGLRYYFPHAKISDSGYVNVGSSVYNYPVQALATAEIIPVAVTYFWHRIMAEGLEDRIIPVNTVHDSVICEVHPDAVQDFKRIAIRSFGRDVLAYLLGVYGLDWDVPLGIGLKVGKYWGEGDEETWNTLPDGTVEKVK